GIDSSSIVCAIHHEYPDVNIRTLSMVYPGKPNDESKYVNIIVAATKAKAEYISPNADDFANDLFDLIRTQQEPFQGLAIYGQYQIKKYAHYWGIKILMDGAGADTLLAPKLARKPDNMITFDRIKNCLFKEGFRELIRKTILFNQTRNNRKQNNAIAEKVLFCKDELLICEEDRAKINIPKSSYNLRNDRNGTRWGIITRTPFFDRSIQEFGASLPNEWRIQNGISKYIFRQSMTGILPEGVLNRKDKQGYVLPDYELMSSPSMRDIVKEITHSDSFLSREYWDGILVQKLFDDLYNGKVQWNAIFWRIINVEIWHRIYFDGHKKTTVHSDINSLDQPPAQMQGKMS
ncbi:MAG: asparagine synthase, partial [Bacteroidales bacterium]|nr:asparagine synthase [Bacteroidales bacterium]